VLGRKSRRDIRAEPSPSVISEHDAEQAYGDPARVYPSRVSLLWIRFVSKHLWLTHLGSALAVFGLIHLALYIFGVEGRGFWIDFLRELFIIFLSLLIPVLGTVAALNRPLRPMLKIVAQSSAGGGVIVAFFGDTFMRMGINLIQLRNGGAELEPWQVTEWVRRCFKAANGQYIGTDSHLPGVYKKLYSDYLAAHKDYLATTRLKDSVRIVLVEIEQLRTDRNENPEEFNAFMQWHAREPVALLRLSPYANQELVKEHKWNPKLINADIGFWRGDFALLFERPEPTERSVPAKVRVWLAIQGEPLYEECSQYVSHLLQETHFKEKTQADVTAELPIYSDELSKHWRLFCDPDERVAITGRFLEEVLSRFEREPGEIKVFDAATGIGVEATHLLKRGYFLLANELEPALREAAQNYAKEKDTHIPEALFTRLDWLTMSGSLPSNFQAVYVLGNSLCHLESMGQVQQVLENFYDTLAPGGILICDERNFAYILENWDHIEEDPWNHFRFNQREEKVMYHGRRVMGAPVKHRAGRLIFEYAEVSKQNGKIVPEQVVGELSMLPFSKNKLRTAIHDAGFRSIEVYCDLDRDPEDRIRNKADFLTYVAVKPSAGSQAARWAALGT
jgi:SAM-dependent methyltransferase